MDSNNTVAVSTDVSPTLTPKKRGRPLGSKNKTSGPKIIKPRFAVVLEDGSLRLLGRGRPPKNVTIVEVTVVNQSALIGSNSPVMKAAVTPSLDSPIVAVG